MTTRTFSFTTSIEADVTVEVEVSGRNIPARVNCSNDNASPAEDADIEITAVMVGTRTLRINILDALTTAEVQALMDDAEWRAAESEAEERACRAEDARDARRDEMAVRS
jgi:hypothetical protein